ncbi:MAG TPA: hypothetical protein VMX12_07525 [Acidimicrobiia bacterium]|nr:hypothetical protein [Acidimicrobiia bacterium]
MTATATSKDYPEHAKLRAVADKSQAIGEFLDEWLPTQGIILAHVDRDGRVPSIQELLAEFFGIDRDKLEAEKRAMLESLR